jgi:hypothetical protein
VPFSAFCVDALAASSPELLLVLPPPDPPALVLEDELSSELQATMESATAATSAATRTTAVRVMLFPLFRRRAGGPTATVTVVGGIVGRGSRADRGLAPGRGAFGRSAP